MLVGTSGTTLPTNIHLIPKKMSSNTCQLNEGEGESLTSVQEKLNLYENIFKPGGEAASVLEQQETRMFCADKKKKAAPKYQPGEHVFVASHPLINASQGGSSKVMPRKDGPYMSLT
ncbi:hypothetical protein NPIL_304231 [Nephila pilipes]|uniref:Uncharacterized protein n=1 Tax=Nephila pilipes TaxID=299642 RepID=A0A8X6Q519_NEPPI|nr:hypothetical protein NPIL_304231 [Nephila pilipes]